MPKANDAEVKPCPFDEERDKLIRKLWLVFQKISDVRPADEFPKEDLALWMHVTRHTAIQSRMGNLGDME